MSGPVDFKGIEALSPEGVRTAGRETTGSPPPAISPALLRLALTWELQAKACGGIPKSTARRLDQAAAGPNRSPALRPGIRLVREWNGVQHVVTAGDDGLPTWNGRSWNSLSEVAREITGVRWSGPAFFGLKRGRRG